MALKWPIWVEVSHTNVPEPSVCVCMGGRGKGMLLEIKLTDFSLNCGVIPSHWCKMSQKVFFMLIKSIHIWDNKMWWISVKQVAHSSSTSKFENACWLNPCQYYLSDLLITNGKGGGSKHLFPKNHYYGHVLRGFIYHHFKT